MDVFKLRRPSYSSAFNTQEPLIVVEESGNGEDDDSSSNKSSPRASLDIDSPVNPYLLSPWRDARETRKHSLPTLQCTSGITASQVRRLSERGGDGSGPTPREAAFLATLSQARNPAPGGRRHSIVTISKVPETIFGRSRRESIAALPAAGRILGLRRDSLSNGPPSTDPRGSIHNLQLDIMDDIVQARKARMKLWNTSSEKVCEVQTLDDAGTSSPMRYTNRRYSDFVGAPLTTIQSHRRASEYPCVVSPSIPEIVPLTEKKPEKNVKKTKMGIVCSNTDLKSLLTTLTSSATEINELDDVQSAQVSSSSSNKRSNSQKSHRSKSFDVSALNNVNEIHSNNEEQNTSMSSWFVRRHQPIYKKKSSKIAAYPMISFSRDGLKDNKENTNKRSTNKVDPLNNVKWDCKGSVVDAHIIGSAIEGFLRRETIQNSSNKVEMSKQQSTSAKCDTSSETSSKSPTNLWFNKTDDDDSTDTCDATFCSTLKDLFVK